MSHLPRPTSPPFYQKSSDGLRFLYNSCRVPVSGISPNVSLVVEACRNEAPVLRAVAKRMHTLYVVWRGKQSLFFGQGADELKSSMKKVFHGTNS